MSPVPTSARSTLDQLNVNAQWLAALALDGESFWITDSALGRLNRHFFASECQARIALQAG